MKERRKYERFQLVLPTKMEMITEGKRQILNLQTKDISASGAFLKTTEKFAEGTRCQLELTITSKRIRELTGSQSCIKVEVVVVRSTPEGIAICFDGDCQILSLKNSYVRLQMDVDKSGMRLKRGFLLFVYPFSSVHANLKE